MKGPAGPALCNAPPKRGIPSGPAPILAPEMQIETAFPDGRMANTGGITLNGD